MAFVRNICLSIKVGFVQPSHWSSQPVQKRRSQHCSEQRKSWFPYVIEWTCSLAMKFPLGLIWKRFISSMHIPNGYYRNAEEQKTSPPERTIWPRTEVSSMTSLGIAHSNDHERKFTRCASFRF